MENNYLICVNLIFLSHFEVLQTLKALDYLPGTLNPNPKVTWQWQDKTWRIPHCPNIVPAGQNGEQLPNWTLTRASKPNVIATLDTQNWYGKSLQKHSGPNSASGYKKSHFPLRKCPKMHTIPGKKVLKQLNLQRTKNEQNSEDKPWCYSFLFNRKLSSTKAQIHINETNPKLNLKLFLTRRFAKKKLVLTNSVLKSGSGDISQIWLSFSLLSEDFLCLLI